MKIVFFGPPGSGKTAAWHLIVRQVLGPSWRSTTHVLQAKDLGCQIITTPPKIIEKINNFGKSYNSLTLDTVKGFLKDSQKSKFRI